MTHRIAKHAPLYAIVITLLAIPHPVQGRYLSGDGMNLYQYVRSQPTHYIDWTGAAADVPDNTNREDVGFEPVTDPFADILDHLIAGPLPHWNQCELPHYNEKWKGDGKSRQYNKYDAAFVGSVLWWLSPNGVGQDHMYHWECICKIAALVKAIAWQESHIGYSSGFSNRGRYPNQNKGWIDTEDVMQVGHPADLPIHKKVPEIYGAFPETQTWARPDVEELGVPENYTYKNISGNQSIFYGVGWFFRKLQATELGCVCDDAALKEALVGYNGNTTPDAWNDRQHRYNYADSVWRLYDTGIYRSPSSGQVSPTPVWTK